MKRKMVAGAAGRLARGVFMSLCLLGLQASTASAVPFSEVVAFGDSLADTGNLFVATGGAFPPPPYFAGRFSNGPVWVEHLASGLGLAAPAPSVLGGTNYAWGGAETGSGLSTRGTPNLGEQIGAFLSAHTPSSDQLFVVWGGANDFNNAGGALPAPADIVNNIATHISDLANAAPAGEHLSFLVPNLPLLGESVRAQWLGANVDPTIPVALNALSDGFNGLLAAALADLEAGLDITIFDLDVAALMRDVVDDPLAFGFTNITDTARLGTKADGSPVDVQTFLFPDPGVVANPDEYAFFDDVHPTAAWHRLLGDRAVAAVVPEPATIVLYGLGVVGLCATAARRRVGVKR